MRKNPGFPHFMYSFIGIKLITENANVTTQRNHTSNKFGSQSTILWCPSSGWPKLSPTDPLACINNGQQNRHKHETIGGKHPSLAGECPSIPQLYTVSYKSKSSLLQISTHT